MVRRGGNPGAKHSAQRRVAESRGCAVDEGGGRSAGAKNKRSTGVGGLAAAGALVIELTQGLNRPMIMIQLGNLRLLQAVPLN